MLALHSVSRLNPSWNPYSPISESFKTPNDHPPHQSHPKATHNPSLNPQMPIIESPILWHFSSHFFGWRFVRYIFRYTVFFVAPQFPTYFLYIHVRLCFQYWYIFNGNLVLFMFSPRVDTYFINDLGSYWYLNN